MFRAERTNFRGVILLHSTDNKKVSQLGSWTESVDYKKENILPGSPSPPRRAQSSIRESNASSCWGFLGRQCCSAEHQHCIQSTPKVAWETALQRGELFHLVLFKPQKAILNPRISSGINTRSYETLSSVCNTPVTPLTQPTLALQAAINEAPFTIRPHHLNEAQPMRRNRWDKNKRLFPQVEVIYHKQPACSTPQHSAESISHTFHYSITDLVT